jgi:lambda family phage portal protein
MLEASYQKILARHFDAASTGNRFKNWRPPGTSSNTESLRSLAMLRNRSRDLVRNNPYAERAVRVIQTHTVGTGIMPSPRTIRNGAAAQRSVDDIKFAWERWAESRECDADGRLDIYGLQSLVKAAIARDGEVLVRKRRRYKSDGLTVPLQLQILEADFLDTAKDGVLSNGGKIIQGVEYDSRGRRVAYWIFQDHPGEFGTGAGAGSVRVPAEDIEHIYRLDRSGQVRGIPYGTSCMVRLRDFDDFEDAQLVRQKVASAFAGFIQDIEAPETVLSPKDLEDEFGDIEPGRFEILPSGKTITFPTTPSASDDGHSSRTLHSIAVGYGVSYESLTGDFSGVTFSSARMARIDFWLNMDQWQHQIMIPGFCVPTWRWFTEAASLEGYDSLHIGAGWTPPRRQMVDPTREVPSRIAEIRAGLKSFSESVRENGDDPEAHIKQLKEDAAAIDKAGLILDCDPRKTQKAGGTQAYITDANGTDKKDESSKSNDNSK